MSNSLRFLKLHPDARLPTRGSMNAAGLDLYAIESTMIPARGHLPVRTGLAVAVPSGFYGRLAPRSGLAINHGIDVLAGVIDSDYRGEVICVLMNNGDSPFFVEAGSRMSQLIIEAITTLHPEWSEELGDTIRGAAGLGSTGSA